MNREPSLRRTLAGVALLAMAARVAALASGALPPPGHFPDERVTWTLAASLVEDGDFRWPDAAVGLTRRASHPPLVPLLAALGRALFGTGAEIFLRAVNIAAGGVFALATAWGAARLAPAAGLDARAGRRAALAAGVAAALAPLPVAMTGYALTEPVALALLALAPALLAPLADLTPFPRSASAVAVRSEPVEERTAAGATSAIRSPFDRLRANGGSGAQARAERNLSTQHSALSTRYSADRARALGAGLALGALALTRAAFVAFPLLMVGALMLLGPRARRSTGWLLVGALAAVAPWTLRNAWVFGAFVPVTTQTGEALYEACGPDATGGIRRDTMEWPPELAGAGEIARDRGLTRRALAALAADPARALHLAGVKVARTWSPVLHRAEFRGPFADLAAGVDAALVLAALAGLAVWRRRWRAWLLPALPALYLGLLHTVFLGSVRYRVPVWAGAAMLLGLHAAAWCEWRRRRAARTAG